MPNNNSEEYYLERVGRETFVRNRGDGKTYCIDHYFDPNQLVENPGLLNLSYKWGRDNIRRVVRKKGAPKSLIGKILLCSERTESKNVRRIKLVVPA